MRSIVLIVHNVRSAHNVGSLLRTADGLGITSVYLSGYTPYPMMSHDGRLPHIALRIDKQIHKTALGAEETVDWHKAESLEACILRLRTAGYELAALEQTAKAVVLSDYSPPQKIALILGNEVNGVENEVLDVIDTHLQIPMLGAKESFNVAAAGAMAMYYLRYMSVGQT